MSKTWHIIKRVSVESLVSGDNHYEVVAVFEDKAEANAYVEANRSAFAGYRLILATIENEPPTDDRPDRPYVTVRQSDGYYDASWVYDSFPTLAEALEDACMDTEVYFVDLDGTSRLIGKAESLKDDAYYAALDAI